MEIGLRQALLTVMTFVLAGAAGALTATAQAEGCPNEALRAGGLENPATHEPYSAGLPDCRAYEQVSPVDKNLSDATGPRDTVQSSPSGEGVTFLSVVPFPGVPGAAEYPTYLATRGGAEWSTQGLLPESDPGTSTQVLGLTEDLAYTLVAATEPLLAPGATPGPNYYVHDNLTGGYQLLAPGPAELHLAGATSDDSRIFFEDEAQLLPSAAPRVVNLYEWSGGRLSLVGVLPNGSAPAGGSVAGPGGPALGSGSGEGQLPGGATSGFYTQNTISTGGSRVFFSDVGTGQIYVRESGAVTVQVSASQRSEPDPSGTRPAQWRAATADGRYVFFTSEEKLTDDSTAVSGRPDLYRFDVEGEGLVDLTTGASAGAGVLGTLGVSADGSYVYFAATAALTSGATEAAEHANLYEWHEGVSTFIAGLENKGNIRGDGADWRNYFAGGAETEGRADGGSSSRVTPDGKTMLFSKGSSIDLYSASRGTLTTVASNAYLAHTDLAIGVASRNAFLPRNLSADGNRVFFQTAEALVPQATNGQIDVYEWEREGAGTCGRSSEAFSEGSGGCLYLISTGTSASVSYFGDASADGRDVFFFTHQRLVGQDQDDNADIYDARVGGGIAAQNPPAPPAPCSGEACLGVLGSPPVLGAPSTNATFSGVGNLTPALTSPMSTPATKPLTRAQKLAKALKACKKQSKKRRRSCESHARKKYGKTASKAARARGIVGRRRS
jgi:hypothetical protein